MTIEARAELDRAHALAATIPNVLGERLRRDRDAIVDRPRSP
ncbi:Hypothetical protein A7982_04600 [Minicystis rosea]|nr:Hypothetical protein A7982_04600 [Minicystis rosea]